MSGANSDLVHALAEALRPALVDAVANATREAIQAVQPPPSPLLTVAQVARRLRTCDETVRRLHKRGALLPVTALLPALRFKPEDVDLLIDQAGKP